MLLECGIGLVRESSSDDFFNASSTRSIGEQSRVNAVAGDDAESVQFRHDARLPARRKQKSFNAGRGARPGGHRTLNRQALAAAGTSTIATRGGGV